MWNDTNIWEPAFIYQSCADKVFGILCCKCCKSQQMLWTAASLRRHLVAGGKTWPSHLHITQHSMFRATLTMMRQFWNLVRLNYCWEMEYLTAVRGQQLVAVKQDPLFVLGSNVMSPPLQVPAVRPERRRLLKGRPPAQVSWHLFNKCWICTVSFVMTPAHVLRRVLTPEPEKVNPLALPRWEGEDPLWRTTVWTETDLKKNHVLEAWNEAVCGSSTLDD